LNPEVNPSPERCTKCNLPRRDLSHGADSPDYQNLTPEKRYMLAELGTHPFTPEPPSQKNDPPTERPTHCVNCGAISDWCAAQNVRCCLYCTHAPSTSETVGERRQVNRGELGTPVRFEIETDEGWVIRFEGKEAADHVEALDYAASLAVVHGAEFPRALPFVSRRSTVTPEAELPPLPFCPPHLRLVLRHPEVYAVGCIQCERNELKARPACLTCGGDGLTVVDKEPCPSCSHASRTAPPSIPTDEGTARERGHRALDVYLDAPNCAGWCGDGTKRDAEEAFYTALSAALVEKARCIGCLSEDENRGAIFTEVTR
jgi:hypothetical protein